VRDLIGKRNWFFAFSLALTVPGLIFILLGPLTGGSAGLQFSIDYTGGTKWEIRFGDRAVTPAQVKAVLVAEGTAMTVRRPRRLPVRTGRSFVIAASRPRPSARRPSRAPVASDPRQAAPLPRERDPQRLARSPGLVAPLPGAARPGAHRRDGALDALEAELGAIESQRQLTTIGPVISAELTQQAIILVLIGSIGILLWMTFRFRDFRFGATALVALVHDVIVVVGAFAVLGTLFGLEVDGLFVTAMLTIIGFSVHDTIVVYDRIRENRSRHAGERFSSIVNHSILQTLARSINTSLTVVFTLTALFLFGGDSIRPFILALLIGITSGTYSSIFIAAPLLTVWEEWEARRKERAAPGRPVRRAPA
jgi:preprotein translocase subunit SecF